MNDRTDLTYANAGVRYLPLDRFKQRAQIAARSTATQLSLSHHHLNVVDVDWSRGESAHLVEDRQCYYAHVVEGLGTKILVADAMYRLMGNAKVYRAIARDAVAVIVNDLSVVGAHPLAVNMYLAVGDARWFEDNERSTALINGWRSACEYAMCAWGGGETSILKGIVADESCVLGGSGFGMIKPRPLRHRWGVLKNDAIVLVPSSGIHANGVSLARKVIEKLPRGYLTALGKRLIGTELLRPTMIYDWLPQLIEESKIHYCVPISGHGWRKLMRYSEPFVYKIERIPKPHPIFQFLQENGPISDEEAYATFNMGAGLALFVLPQDAERVVDWLEDANDLPPVLIAGHVEKRGGEKKVIIEPRGIVFEESTLAIR